MKSLPSIYKSQNVVVSKEIFPLPEYLPVKQASQESDNDLQQAAQAQAWLEQAQAQAQSLLAQAQAQAELIRAQAREQAQREHDNLLIEAEQQAQTIRMQAYEQGVAEGSRAQAKAIADCISEIELAVGRLEGEQSGFIAEYESDLKWLALEIASKVLNKKLEQDDTEMLELVKVAVDSIKNAEWIAIEISEQMTGLLSRLHAELEKGNACPQVDILSRPVPIGTCMIDTPSGMIDASVFTQIENLRDYFLSEEQP